MDRDDSLTPPAAGSPSTRGWAVVALLLTVPAPTIGVVLGMWIFPGTRLGNSAYILSKLWLAALPVVWWVAIERRRLSLSPARRGGLLFGLASGLGIAALITGSYFVLGESLIDRDMMRSAAATNELDHAGRYLALALYLITVNSLLEEYVWRWFVYSRCRVLVGPVTAALATAVCFTLHHVLALKAQLGWGVTLLSSGGILIGSLIWSWCYARYDSIWPAYLSHVVADIAVLWIGWELIF